MKEYILKKYYRFILVITIIFTLSLVFAGKITAEERGKEIFTGEKYKTVMIENRKDALSVSDGEREYLFGKDMIFKLRRVGNVLKYTPLNTLIYALEINNS